MNEEVFSGAFLRTSRSFPEDIHQLAIEINRTYIDIARAVNNRVNAVFTINRSNATGESWFLRENRRQAGIRQTYEWDDSNLTIAHGINLSTLSNVVRIFGTFYDGTNWQLLPYVDVVAVTNQIAVEVTPTQIVITKGGGAPTCTEGLVTLEFLANP